MPQFSSTLARIEFYFKFYCFPVLHIAQSRQRPPLSGTPHNYWCGKTSNFPVLAQTVYRRHVPSPPILGMFIVICLEDSPAFSPVPAYRRTAAKIPRTLGQCLDVLVLLNARSVIKLYSKLRADLTMACIPGWLGEIAPCGSVFQLWYTWRSKSPRGRKCKGDNRE
jgi:hypothetical protein